MAFGAPDENRPVTAPVTASMIPPLAFFERLDDRFPFDFDLPPAVVFLEVSAALLPPADCLAPPEAVRFPAPPLFVAVEVFEPPVREAAADLAAPTFEPAFLAVPGDFDAPVLLVPELFDAALLFEPPVFDVADLVPPWLDLDEEPDFADVFLPDDLDELFAVAIFIYLHRMTLFKQRSSGYTAANEIYVGGSKGVCILPYFA